jgi:Phosphodiester glycosidase
MHSSPAWIVALTCWLFAHGAAACGPAQPSRLSPPPVLATKAMDPVIQQEQLPDGTSVSWVTVLPGSGFRVTAALPAKGTQSVFAWQATGKPTINGGFFDPSNGQTTSHITTATGQTLRPQDNRHLWDNPKLAPYLPAIANRSEFRTLACTTGITYQITAHDTGLPTGCSLVSALGAGPQLLPTATETLEAFIDAKTGRDAIGFNRPDARSAVGIRKDGAVLLVLVGQTVNDGVVHGGLSVPQVAQWLVAHEVVSALNLDGGSSSSLWSPTSGEVLGKFNRKGEAVRRPVLSVLQVEPLPAPIQNTP